MKLKWKKEGVNYWEFIWKESTRKIYRYRGLCFPNWIVKPEHRYIYPNLTYYSISLNFFACKKSFLSLPIFRKIKDSILFSSFASLQPLTLSYAFFLSQISQVDQSPGLAGYPSSRKSAILENSVTALPPKYINNLNLIFPIRKRCPVNCSLSQGWIHSQLGRNNGYRHGR